MNKFRWSNCPLCGSAEFHLIGGITYRKPVMFSTNEIDLCQLPELWKCQQCLSSFVQNIVDADTAKTLYSTGQAGERWLTEPFDQNKMQNVIDCMTGIFKNKGKVLDVGCNTGELLDFAHALGCDTSGLEFSSASRRLLINKGHRAYSTFEECSDEYDVITAFDLVEHLYDIPDFFKKCREKLAKNGKLVILTGNIDSLSARFSGAGWWYAQYPEHIVFPSKKYFSEYSDFQLRKWMPTYASKGYKYTIFQLVRGVISSLLKLKYTGLPSFVYDHTLIVLTK